MASLLIRSKQTIAALPMVTHAVAASQIVGAGVWGAERKEPCGSLSVGLEGQRDVLQ